MKRRKLFFTGGNSEQAAKTSNRIVTPANAMTLSRPVLAAQVARMMQRGERGVLWWMAGLAATDASGQVARLTDKIIPGWELGVTAFGEKADPVADSLAFLTVSRAALRSPRVSGLAKAAVGIVLGAERRKAAWAVHASIVAGRVVDMEVTREGQHASTAKFGALLCAVATHEVEQPALRRGFGLAALGFATAGLVQGERALADYSAVFWGPTEPIVSVPLPPNPSH